MIESEIQLYAIHRFSPEWEERTGIVDEYVQPPVLRAKDFSCLAHVCLAGKISTDKIYFVSGL